MRNWKSPSAVEGRRSPHLVPPSCSFFSAALKFVDAVEVLRQAVVADAGRRRRACPCCSRGRSGAYRTARRTACRRRCTASHVAGAKSSSLRAHRRHVVGGDLGERVLADRQRDARGVIRHHVRAFADRGRGLHLGVERHAPVERRRLDFDLAVVLGVELLDAASSCGRRRRRRGSPTRSPFPWPARRRRTPAVPPSRVSSIIKRFMSASSTLFLFRALGRASEISLNERMAPYRAVGGHAAAIQSVGFKLDCRKRRRRSPHRRCQRLWHTLPLPPKNGYTRYARVPLDMTIPLPVRIGQPSI